MAVRTAALGRGLIFGGAGETLLATVPAGETWIVKGCEIALSGLGSSTVQVFATSADLSTRATFIQQLVPSLGVAHYTGFLVMEPGDTLTAASSSVDTNVWVSGTKLAGVAP